MSKATDLQRDIAALEPRLERVRKAIALSLFGRGDERERAPTRFKTLNDAKQCRKP